MAFTPFNGAGGGGSGSDDCTASTAQWRNGYTAIGVGTNDEPANGGIQDYGGATSITPSTVAQSFAVSGKYLTSDLTVGAIPSQKPDSGNVALSASALSKSYPAGWYSNAHGAAINTQTKSATPSTSAQTIYADSNYVMTGFTVGAIPNQTAGGTVKLTASTTASNFAAGQWATSNHYVYVDVFSW